MRLDPSIDPVQLVHRLCSEAHAHPETKKSRWIKRMHPVTSIRKTLSVDLTAFAKEILKPHFHSGGPPKTVSLKPSPISLLGLLGTRESYWFWEMIRSCISL
jgi:tRNA acetyltransferase TAN1